MRNIFSSCCSRNIVTTGFIQHRHSTTRQCRRLRKVSNVIIGRNSHYHYNLQGRNRFYHELSFTETGTDLTNVLEYCRDETQSDLQPPPFPAIDTSSNNNNNESDDSAFTWVRVAMEVAPWNPADLNTIQGRYPTPKSSSLTQQQQQQQLPLSRYFPCRTVAGAQGIGRVTHIVTQNQFQAQDNMNAITSNNNNNGLQIGDWVTVGIPSFGTFRSSVWVPARTSHVDIIQKESFEQGTSSATTTTTSDALLIFKGTSIENGRHLVDQYLRASRQHVAAASMLFQLGGTALRMLRDFLPPQQDNHHPHDYHRRTLVVLQNAANSGVGYMVSQCLRHFVGHTNTLLVSFVRRGDRSDAQVQDMVDYLSSSSASINNGNDNKTSSHDHHHHVILVEDDLHSSRNAMQTLHANLMERISKMNNDGLAPIYLLALNSVGGPSADLLLQLLQRLSSSCSSSPSSPPTMVTYGGMSQQPITVKTGPLVFDNLALRGYWHSRWLAENAAAAARRATASDKNMDSDPRQALLDELVDAAILHQRIQLPPVDLVSLSPNNDNGSNSDNKGTVVTRLVNHSSKQSMQTIRHKLVLDLRET